ncbi:MAG TPA: aminotransferase class IV [Candidatus Saccharimonadales bacterium]|nr:aminotransferase class IV [Candidatus Saccharimonadales bacterium]
MSVFLNGKLVPEEQAAVSVFDRGFLYGDGLLETIRISNGKPFRWNAHMARLARGAKFLNIRLPFSPAEMRASALELVRVNDTKESILRIVLTRGAGERGYSPKGAEKPTLVMSLHPAPVIATQKPPQWRLITTSYRVQPGDPLAKFKTCNKLRQILARREADEAGADEGLLLDEYGLVAEATSGNIFWVDKEWVHTPPVEEGVLPGVTRAIVFELCKRLGFECYEGGIRPDLFPTIEGVFVSLSSWGIVEVSHMDGRKLMTSEIVARLRGEYQRLVQEETST